MNTLSVHENLICIIVYYEIWLLYMQMPMIHSCDKTTGSHVMIMDNMDI